MTNEATRLAACPFCGSDKISEDFGDESGCVRCRNCGCQSGRVFFTDAEKESDDFSRSEADAREAWNLRATLAQPAVSEEAQDAARYRWLRDVSVPPHNFYISVPAEFDGVRYTPVEVDAAIDAAMASQEKPHD